MTYTPGQRAATIAAVVAGLRKGTPLTVILSEDGMLGYTTFWEWCQGDQRLSEAIARAREVGHDQIAMDALAIADEVTEQDTIETAHGPTPNKEWLMRSKRGGSVCLHSLAGMDKWTAAG